MQDLVRHEPPLNDVEKPATCEDPDPSRRSRWQHSLRYTQEYQRSVESPEDFWAEAAKDVQWFRPWDKVLDDSQGPIHKWFAGAQLNTGYNALDFHVACDRGKSVAIRYDSPLSNTHTNSQCLGVKQVTASPYPGIKFGVSRAVPGYNIQLMGAEKSELDARHGHNHDSDEPDKELVVKLPLPPGTVTTLYNNESEFHAKYLQRFPGYYHMGDTGHIDEDGCVY